MIQSIKQLYWDLRFGSKRVLSLRNDGLNRIFELFGKQWRWQRNLSRYEKILYFDRFKDDFSLEDKRYYLEYQFKDRLGYSLNLDNPRTFNEKLQWLKFYYHNPLLTLCSDKYLVRDYIKERIGEEYLIPLLGVYNNAEEIDFDVLPNRFVLKVNWGSGQNIICKDKSQLDIPLVKQQLQTWLDPKNNHYYNHLEWGYKDILPKIICEGFIENSSEDLYDYKFFCFNGKVNYIMFLAERQQGLKMKFFDRTWVKQDFVYSFPMYEKVVPAPKSFNVMIDLAEKLSKNFPHTRVDFFNVNEGKIYAGEMTFYSCGGFCKWNLPEWDLKLGELLQLPDKWV